MMPGILILVVSEQRAEQGCKCHAFGKGLAAQSGFHKMSNRIIVIG